MQTQKIEQISGTAIPLLLDDIDTDRIIPARYLRCVTFDGLGEHAFEDDRAQDSQHPFDNPAYRNAAVLIAGRNFGCGSSREHAPQALMRWGIQGIVAESFAEIFFGNCTSLGIPAVCAPRADLEKLREAVVADPTVSVTIDLVKQELTCGNRTCTVTIPESARESLVTGQWDFLGQLLEAEDAIRLQADKVPYFGQFAE